jgi:hypothetical protein
LLLDLLSLLGPLPDELPLRPESPPEPPPSPPPDPPPPEPPPDPPLAAASLRVSRAGATYMAEIVRPSRERAARRGIATESTLVVVLLIMISTRLEKEPFDLLQQSTASFLPLLLPHGMIFCRSVHITRSLLARDGGLVLVSGAPAPPHIEDANLLAR